MPRVKGETVTRARRKRVLKLATGYNDGKKRLFNTAKQQVIKSGKFEYSDRRQKKRYLRKLWITRINAADRMNNLSVSKKMHGLKVAGVDINRKMLGDVAVNEAEAFSS